MLMGGGGGGLTPGFLPRAVQQLKMLLRANKNLNCDTLEWKN